MNCSINWDKLSATHSPRARTVCARHTLQRAVRSRRLRRSVRTTVWETQNPPPPLDHIVCVVAILALVMRSVFFLRPSIPHHLVLCRRSRLLPVSGPSNAQRLLSQSADSHLSEPTFPLPILDFQADVCPLCDPSRKPMWAASALDCLACPGKHAPMGAEDLTDNEED